MIIVTSTNIDFQQESKRYKRTKNSSLDMLQHWYTYLIYFSNSNWNQDIIEVSSQDFFSLTDAYFGMYLLFFQRRRFDFDISTYLIFFLCDLVSLRKNRLCYVKNLATTTNPQYVLSFKGLPLSSVTRRDIFLLKPLWG